MTRNAEPLPAIDTQAAEIERLTKERDAAFAMSRCECASNEACANLVSKDVEIASLRASAHSHEVRRLKPVRLTDEDIGCLYSLRSGTDGTSNSDLMRCVEDAVLRANGLLE